MGEDYAATLHLDDHLKVCDEVYDVQNRTRQERFVGFFGQSNVDMIRKSICDVISMNEIPKHKLDDGLYGVQYSTPIKPIRSIKGFYDFLSDKSLRDSALQQEVDTNDQFQVTSIHVGYFPLIHPRFHADLYNYDNQCGMIIVSTLFVLPVCILLYDYFTIVRKYRRALKEDSVKVNVFVKFRRRRHAPAQGIPVLVEPPGARAEPKSPQPCSRGEIPVG